MRQMSDRGDVRACGRTGGGPVPCDDDVSRAVHRGYCSPALHGANSDTAPWGQFSTRSPCPGVSGMCPTPSGSNLSVSPRSRGVWSATEIRKGGETANTRMAGAGCRARLPPFNCNASRAEITMVKTLCPGTGARFRCSRSVAARILPSFRSASGAAGTAHPSPRRSIPCGGAWCCRSACARTPRHIP